jgi:probable rRNA maturation factor
MITITNRQRKIAVSLDVMRKQVATMLSVLRYDDFDIGILLTTDESIRRYNRDFRHKDKPTDILSFPFYPDLKPGERIKPLSQDEKNLGDIIISVAYVQRKAPEWNRTFEEHLTALLAHGIAHLLNYDHQTDEEFKVMQRVEKKILKAVVS